MSGYKNLPVRWCPHCEATVTLDRVMSGGVEVFKCNNCWALHMSLEDLNTKPSRRDTDATSTTYR